MSDIDIAVVSDRLHSVAGEPVLDPVSATLLGPVARDPQRVFPESFVAASTSTWLRRESAQLAVKIIAEHCAPFSDSAVAIRRGERWIESLERIDLQASPSQSRLRQTGVYLITGGLGDLGLVIADELARDLKARLVLLGRTSLPPAESWQDALEATGTPDRVKQQIRKLIEIESLGAEVLYLSCDVCRRDELKRAIELALARFGSISGVIHAAGVIEDSPLLIKSRESAARVLDPKVRGTLVLDDVLREVVKGSGRDMEMDFFVLFSSVSSVLAPAGQVDYTAANAFLDAFAASRRDARVLAINWGPWRDLGMAARASSTHPLLGRRLVDTADEIVYSVPLSCERHWVLAEHRLKDGPSVFPGTGYLEMAFAALTHGSFDHGVEFEDVFFRAPLIAQPGQPRERAWICYGLATELSSSPSAHAPTRGSNTPPGRLPGAGIRRLQTAPSSGSSPAVNHASWPSMTLIGPGKRRFSISVPGGGA